MDRNGSYNYTYDTLNRLVQAVNPLLSNPLETYTYDPVGNRTNSNQNGASIFNQANELTEDANFTYQYDANGNLTRKTAKVGGAFTNYEYDAENKLVRVVTPGRTVNYRYDGLGRRVEKEIIEVTTTVRRYIYDQEDILLELDGSNNIVTRYTHGPGIDEPLIMEKSGASFFYHADGLGSITEITNSSSAVTQRYTYSSFGKIESQLDPTFTQPYTFTSREFDPETGLYFYRARYYDTTTGRFLTEDPIRFLSGINFYPYAGNSPTDFTDPSGLLFGGAVDAGETYGEYAAQYWADRLNETGNPIYYLPGLFASLWTSCTSDITALTLLTAGETGAIVQSGIKGAVRFFYDPRKFKTISQSYWRAKGGANGLSLHHWLIPQSARWAPQGIKNAGWNLVAIPGRLNTWMGFAQKWGGTSALLAKTAENAIRVLIPGSLGAAAALGAGLGEK